MQVEGVQKEQEKEQQKEKKQSKLVGWSTEHMEEKQRNQEFKHSGEMVLWMSIDQEGMNQMWKKQCQRMKEEVLEKYKVEVSNRGA